MKLLLVGPYPPPHGGVSVHVRNAHALLTSAGVDCGVLNIKGRASLFLGRLARYAFDDWKIHVHTNGHNPKSWFVALSCGLAAQMGSGGVLTLHSGLLPGYLEASPKWLRRMAQFTCLLYDRVVCVNEEIAEALRAIDVPPHQLAIMPAFLPAPAPEIPVPHRIREWIGTHEPLLAMTLSFRPEYGFELLAAALQELRLKFPQIGCLVIGGRERSAATKLIHQLGLGAHLLLTGDVSYDLCLRLMSCADLFVRPTFNDGDANSVREALAMGTPVVASNVGNRPDGVVLFEPGDLNGLIEAIDRGLQVQRLEQKPEPVDYTGKLLALYAAKAW